MEHIETLKRSKMSQKARDLREVEAENRRQRQKERALRAEQEKRTKLEKQLRDVFDPPHTEKEIEKQLKEFDVESRERVNKEKVLPNEIEKCEARVAKLETSIQKASSRITLKDDSKTVALGTSKINYMDPRITVAWCKRKDVPVEKIFAKTLLQKFPWAMEVPSTWRF